MFCPSSLDNINKSGVRKLWERVWGLLLSLSLPFQGDTLCGLKQIVGDSHTHIHIQDRYLHQSGSILDHV